MKTFFLQNRISTILAWFHLTRENVVTSIPRYSLPCTATSSAVPFDIMSRSFPGFTQRNLAKITRARHSEIASESWFGVEKVLQERQKRAGWQGAKTKQGYPRSWTSAMAEHEFAEVPIKGQNDAILRYSGF